jgi:DNA replication protein DnaC
VPVSHPDFGKAIPCQCRERERQEKRMLRMQKFGTLETLERMTFDNFSADLEHLSPEKQHNLLRACEIAVDYAREPEGWLLLTGTYGCGKTHLAAAIANARLQSGGSVLFMVVPDLLDYLRTTYSSNSDVSFDNLFDQVRTTPLLILDDLGTQSSTAWAQEKLFQLLNHRYNAQLPTVITSNQRMEDLDPRLRSRLLDESFVMHWPIYAPDFRAGSSPPQSELSTLNLHGDQRFDTFNVRRSDLDAEERSNLQDAVEVCREFAQTPHGWLILAGTYGCGKTHLAAAIANYQLEHAGYDVMLIVTPDLLDHLRATYSPQSTVSFDRRFEDIKTVPMLILDDLGTESASPWAREKLFQLLNYRYQALLPTVITTTTMPDQIDPWLGTRMFDKERCRFEGLIVPGYRGSGSQQQATRQRRVRR